MCTAGCLFAPSRDQSCDRRDPGSNYGRQDGGGLGQERTDACPQTKSRCTYGQQAQVHLMQPQTPAKIFVHTAVEPRPQSGLGCLPQHGPGGPPLAAAVSAPSRTIMAKAAVAAMTAMKN